MTVSTTTTKHIYDGNGVTTYFAYTFPIIESTDISVYITDDSAVVTKLVTGYTVDTLNTRIVYPSEGSGLDVLPTGWKITVARENPLTQELHLTRSGPLDADSIEDAFDKLTMITQQHSETFSRCIRYDIDQTPTVTETTGFLETLQDLKDDTVANAAAALESKNTAAKIAATIPKNKVDATTAPTATEDSGDGYGVGSQWSDVTNDKQYVCLDATLGNAIWKEMIDQNSIQTFANKKFDSPVHAKQSITPTNPASGYNKLYFKSDNKIYILNSSGTETELKTDWLNSTSNKVFASDAAFVAAKGTGAVDGDCYLNSADNLIHFYIDSAWRTQAANIIDGSVTEGKIAANAVIEAKINNGAVTPAKLSTGHPDWDSSSNFKFNSGYGSNAIAYGCRAWINLNTITTTPTVNASGNVSSVTDDGVGKFTINFSNNMPDTNYTVVSTVGDENGHIGVIMTLYRAESYKTVSIIRMTMLNQNSTDTDYHDINVAIFR